MFSLVVHASMKVTSTVLQKIYNKRQLVILIFFAMIKEPFKNVFFLFILASLYNTTSNMFIYSISISKIRNGEVSKLLLMSHFLENFPFESTVPHPSFSRTDTLYVIIR